ncbi:MAG: type IV pilus modification PilV family protein [Polyangiales bacterium]
MACAAPPVWLDVALAPLGCWRRSRGMVQGFTLLEVMVAVAILSIALTAIFSSQVGAVKTAYRARHMGTAALLARCKMGELEEQVAREGLPAVLSKGKDRCCEAAPVKGFGCSWKIKRVVLPDGFAQDEAAQGRLADDAASAASDVSGQAAGVGSSATDMLAGGGGGDMVGTLAMSVALPILKPVLEEQVRRAEVRISWQEGNKRRGFDVVQYLVRGQGADLGADDAQSEDTSSSTPTPVSTPGGG